jgi:DNA-directed RNA polymerase subunit K/omega
MSAANSRISNNESWQKLCEAALLELDSTILPYRILAAEHAIARRARELSEEPGDHNDEREDLDDAAYAMHALRSTLKVPRASIASDGRTARSSAQ